MVTVNPPLPNVFQKWWLNLTGQKAGPNNFTQSINKTSKQQQTAEERLSVLFFSTDIFCSLKLSLSGFKSGLLIEKFDEKKINCVLV